MSKPRPIRKETVDLLALLSSEESQLAYERDVPHVDITKELVCMWFDDLYHPGCHFDSAFTAGELSALARFNQYFEDRLSLLPDRLGRVRSWLTSPVWREIMHEAEKTLREIAAPGEALNGSSAGQVCTSNATDGPPSASCSLYRKKMREYRDASNRLTFDLSDQEADFGLFAKRLLSLYGHPIQKLDDTLGDYRYWDFNIGGTIVVLHSDVMAGVSISVEDGSSEKLLREIVKAIAKDDDI